MAAASITIKVTEDLAPDGHVMVDFDIEGVDISDIGTDGELPPALLLGAQMLKLVEDLPSSDGHAAFEVPGRGRTIP